MNLQSAINAGLFVDFVANGWQTKDPATGARIATTDLDGAPVTRLDGSPVIAGKSYTVAKTIYACDLATVIDPKKGWVTIGFVAANDAEPNDVFIAIRGTLTVWEWVQDAKFLYKPFSNVPSAPLVEDGFCDMYQSFNFEPTGCDKTAPTFLTQLSEVIPATATVTIAGHSLGAALATLLALDMAVHSAQPFVLYTLASPRVGDLSFAHLFNHTVPDAYRVHNRLDIVPQLPPPLMYVHVGDETELVPGKDLRFDLGCEHHLTSYFHMLEALAQLGVDPPPPVAYPLDANCLAGGAALQQPAIAGATLTAAAAKP